MLITRVGVSLRSDEIDCYGCLIVRGCLCARMYGAHRCGEVRQEFVIQGSSLKQQVWRSRQRRQLCDECLPCFAVVGVLLDAVPPGSDLCAGATRRRLNTAGDSPVSTTHCNSSNLTDRQQA